MFTYKQFEKLRWNERDKIDLVLGDKNGYYDEISFITNGKLRIKFYHKNLTPKYLKKDNFLYLLNHESLFKVNIENFEVEIYNSPYINDFYFYEDLVILWEELGISVLDKNLQKIKYFSGEGIIVDFSIDGNLIKFSDDEDNNYEFEL